MDEPDGYDYQSVRLAVEMARLVTTARPSVSYCRANEIDFSVTLPACGGVFLSPIRLVQPRHFEPNAAGTEAAWCEVLAEDGRTVIDAVAWSLRNPSHFRVLLGTAPALGMAAAVNPATYFGDRPLHLHRNPLNWLHSGCDGAVLLDPNEGARWLLDLHARKFAVEDDRHARALLASRQALFSAQSFVVPIRTTPPRLLEAA